MADTKKKRRILKARVSFLSLCPRGMNNLKTLYKEDGSFEIPCLVKQGEEEGTLLAIVYAPENRDLEGDIASVDVVKEMAYSFMQAGANLDIRHDGVAVGRDRAYVAENFIVQKSDTRFHGTKNAQGNPIDVTDAWVSVIKLEDLELRKLYAKDGWQGVSLFGSAEVAVGKECPEMDEEKVKKAVADGISAAMGLLEEKRIAKEAEEKRLADLAKEAEEKRLADLAKEAEASAFKGDPTPENLRKHAAGLRKAEILAKIKTASASEVLALAKQLEEEADGTDPKQAEILRLEKELSAARGGSSMGVPPAGGQGRDSNASLVKAMADYANQGR